MIKSMYLKHIMIKSMSLKQIMIGEMKISPIIANINCSALLYPNHFKVRAVFTYSRSDKINITNFCFEQHKSYGLNLRIEVLKMPRSFQSSPTFLTLNISATLNNEIWRNAHHWQHRELRTTRLGSYTSMKAENIERKLVNWHISILIQATAVWYQYVHQFEE